LNRFNIWGTFLYSGYPASLIKEKKHPEGNNIAEKFTEIFKRLYVIAKTLVVFSSSMEL